MPKRVTYDYVCADCGKPKREAKRPGAKRKYCPVCSYKRKLASQARSTQRNREAYQRDK